MKAEKTRDLAIQYVKLQCDIHFGREPKEDFHRLATAIEEEAKQYGIEPNKLLMNALNNRQEYEAILEKKYNVKYITDVVSY